MIDCVNVMLAGSGGSILYYIHHSGTIFLLLKIYVLQGNMKVMDSAFGSWA